MNVSRILIKLGIVKMLFQNDGRCPICMKKTTFVAEQEWLRDFYFCTQCRTIPRQRALIQILNQISPQWKNLSIHESSPSLEFFKNYCPGYTLSFYYENVPLGSHHEGNRCEDLEQLTFPDECYDLFITQDVMEHVMHPCIAFKEIERVLKPGGLHIFTAPKHKQIPYSYPRAQLINNIVYHLRPPVYHGNPIGDGRSLVTWDYGSDFEELVTMWSGCSVSTYVIRDRYFGIDGEFLEVFVQKKTNQRLNYEEPLKSSINLNEVKTHKGSRQSGNSLVWLKNILGR